MADRRLLRRAIEGFFSQLPSIHYQPCAAEDLIDLGKSNTALPMRSLVIEILAGEMKKAR
jgi:hypothetical protein